MSLFFKPISTFILISFLAFLLPNSGKCYQVNNSSEFLEVKITTFKVDADREYIMNAFAKDEDILHLLIEGEMVVIFTNVNITDEQIQAKIKEKIKANFKFVDSVIGDRNSKLFNR